MSTKLNKEEIHKQNEVFNNVIENKEIREITCSCNYVCYQAPTGDGKTFVMIYDFIKRIDKIIKNDSSAKIIIEICEPQLKLCFQNFGEAIGIWMEQRPQLKNKTIFFINNCDGEQFNDENILEDYEIGTYKLDTEADLYSFLVNPNINIAFIDSCAKSLWKTNKWLKDSKYDNVHKLLYVDECHTISNKSNSDTEDVIENVYLDDIFGNNDKKTREFICFISATIPSETIAYFAKMNGKKMNNQKNSFFQVITPKQSIEEGRILPPEFYTEIYNGSTEDFNKKVFSIYKQCIKNKKGKYYTKLLVNAFNTEHAEELYEQCKLQGYNTAITTSRYGMKININNSESTYAKGNKNGSDENELDTMTTDEKTNFSEFKEKIAELNDNIIVIHIRQLICGIDIAGLTDNIQELGGPIVLDYNKQFTGKIIAVIQTIGRCLRFLNNNDRSILYNLASKRTKQFGTTYFVINETEEAELDKIKKSIANFVLIYYGGTAKIHNNSSHKPGNKKPKVGGGKKNPKTPKDDNNTEAEMLNICEIIKKEAVRLCMEEEKVYNFLHEKLTKKDIEININSAIKTIENTIEDPVKNTFYSNVIRFEGKTVEDIAEELVEDMCVQYC